MIHRPDPRLRSEACGHYEICDIFGEWQRATPAEWRAARQYVATRYITPDGKPVDLPRPRAA